jgi:hypothetical protein
MSRGRKQLAAFATLACITAPSAAFDSLSQPSRGVTFYLSIPLDRCDAKEDWLSAGLAISGQRPYDTVRIDSRMISNLIGGGIEAKWIIAGVVAAGAAVAVGSKDKSTSEAYQQQQQQQAAAQQNQPCPATCP